MTTASLFDTLVSYVPSLVMRRLAAVQGQLYEPATERLSAAVLFTDITGFSTLTERLAQHGPAGAEEVSLALNQYFGRLVEIILAHAGDVVKFAGDGLFALWPVDETRDLTQALNLAAQCALEVQRVLYNHQVADDIRLSMRAGISAGDLHVAHVGGMYDRWEYVLAGTPMASVSAAGDAAQTGDVVVSPEAWLLLEPQAFGYKLLSNHVRLERVTAAPHVPSNGRFLTTPPFIPEKLLKAYVPGAIWDRLAAGQGGWVAELRRVTVLFVSLPDFGDINTSNLTAAHDTMRALQAATYRHEGSINKLNVDDKGVTLVAALGLPPFAHEDDPERGIRTALAFKQELKERGLRGAVGVATGLVFCGSIGNETRREYTMIGDTVNLSARLMQLAGRTEDKAEVPILCDEATYASCIGELEFATLPPAMLKGKAEPVKVYQPRGQKVRRDGHAPIPQSEMIGRKVEWERSAAQLHQFITGNPVGVTVILGEAGIGKTRLVDELRRQAETYGTTVFIGRGDAIEASTSYHAWRGIFSQMLDLSVMTDLDARRQHVLDLLEMEDDLLELAPLLNSVLLLDVPDNDTTAQMEGQMRADNTVRLLLRLLQDSVARSPKLLVLEDAQWMDTASWVLLTLVLERIRHVMVVLVSRPTTQRIPEYDQILAKATTLTIRLEPLSAEETITLVNQCLGVRSLPEVVIGTIQQRTEGHPLYVEQLAYALRDSGLLIIENGVCRLRQPGQTLDSLNLPDTLHGLITSRVDRLSPDQRLTLKVASVIGRTFSFQTLRDIYPVALTPAVLRTNLSQMEALDITAVHLPDPDLTYVFKHSIVQEVVYNLMLFTQRRQLHRTVAEWFESHYEADELEPYYALLAYHWSKAEEGEKAIVYLELAGELALRNYSNVEAVYFLGEAFHWYERLHQQPRGAKPAVTLLRQARWARQMAQAHLSMGNLKETKRHCEQAILFLKDDLPQTPGQWTSKLLRQAFRHIFYLVHMPDPENYDPHHRWRMMELARVYSLLLEVYFVANESIPSLYAAVRSLNFASRVGISAELANGYAGLSAVSAPPMLQWLNALYARRALQTARELRQQGTLARVLTVTTIRRLGNGLWAKARSALQKSIELCQLLDDQRQLQENYVLLGWLENRTGHYEKSLLFYQQAYEIAHRRDDSVRKGWGLDGQAMNLLTLGEHERVAHYLAQAAEVLVINHDRAELLNWHSLSIRLLSRRPDWAQAWRHLTQIEGLMREATPLVYSTIQAYTAVAELRLLAAEKQLPREVTGTDPAQLLPLAKQACLRMWRFARLFPVEWPRALLYWGWYLQLNGRAHAARRAWHKGLALARKYELPYEEGQLHYHLGRSLPTADPERATQLQAAFALFQRINAKYAAEELQQKMSMD
ncbi:MAG: AAA family ATPase [Chloroflexi bacterium]|nr:AAA family ATPase [Chloroflexota bacterium]